MRGGPKWSRPARPCRAWTTSASSRRWCTPARCCTSWRSSCCGAEPLHQQVFACVVAAQDDVVDLADIHQPLAAGITDGALHVLLHLAQRVGQLALDRLEDALAFDVLVLALVEVRGGAVVLLEELAVDLDRAAGRFVVAGEQRADHHHAGAEADALGD